jgi:hypothetical protein
LEAIATATGYLPSAPGSAAYTITPGAQAATPTFSPAAGNHIGTQQVTISDTSIGATIYYTLTPGTAGTAPTANSTVYTGPVTVSGTSVLEAFAVGGGFTTSAVASAAYNITVPPSFVQQCYNNSGGSATMTCTLTGVKAGDALVIGDYSAPITSVTSSTTAQPVSVISNFATDEGAGDFNVYLLPDTPAGSITITATANSGSSANSIVVDEYTNVAASPLDGSATGSCSGWCTTVSSSNFTTASAADMLWSMCNADQVIPTAGTVPIPWTAILAQGNGGVDSGYVDFFVEDGVAGAAGTYYGECSNAYLSSIATVALKPPPAAAALTSPTPGSKLTGSSQVFTWSPGTGVTKYMFHLGTKGAGSDNLEILGSTTATSVNVTGIPTDGVTLYARLYSEIDGAWQYADYTYTEAGTPVAAKLSTPTPGSKLTGSSQVFSWSSGTGVTKYMFHLGTKGAGSDNLEILGSTTATSVNVTGIPTDGVTLYARLYSEIDGAWQYADYTYTEAGTPVAAKLSTPTPGSKLAGSSQVFSWSTGTGVTRYMFHLGTKGVGSDDLYILGSTTATSSASVTVPTDGVKLYARLYSEIDGAWQYTDYTYTAQ